MNTIIKDFCNISPNKNITPTGYQEDSIILELDNDINENIDIKTEHQKLIEKISITKAINKLNSLLLNLNERNNWNETEDSIKYYNLLQIIDNKDINLLTKQEVYFFWYILSSSFTWNCRLDEENKIIFKINNLYSSLDEYEKFVIKERISKWKEEELKKGIIKK